MPATASRLRDLLAAPGPIRSLGAHDVFCALLVEQAGLETVFAGGFGSSASLLGLPDLNFLTQTEMADQVRRMASRLTIPVVADADTGHGEVPQVIRTVALFEQAGAAGLLLEDQVSPKRCGHFEQKQVIEAEAMVAKLKAAQAVRQDPDFVIIARTDARATDGIDEAIDRANRYGDAGADMVFVEAPESLDELEAMAARIRHPQLVNMLTGGKTPILAVDDLGAMGFKIVVCPVESLILCAAAMRRLLHTLKHEGRVDGLIRDVGLGFGDLKDLLGLDDWLTVEHKGG